MTARARPPRTARIEARLRPIGVIRSELAALDEAPMLRAIDGNRLRVGPIEAIDGTPVVDVKPALT